MATPSTAKKIAQLWRDAGLDEKFADVLEAIPDRADAITALRQEVQAEVSRRREVLLARIQDGTATVDLLLEPEPDIARAVGLLDEARTHAIDKGLWAAIAERDVLNNDLRLADLEIVQRARELGRVVGPEVRNGDQALAAGRKAAAAWAEILELADKRDALGKLGRQLTQGLTNHKHQVSRWEAVDPSTAWPRKPESAGDALLLAVGARLGEEVAA